MIDQQMGPALVEHEGGGQESNDPVALPHRLVPGLHLQGSDVLLLTLQDKLHQADNYLLVCQGPLVALLLLWLCIPCPLVA